jgi:hypothetical protein
MIDRQHAERIAREIIQGPLFSSSSVPILIAAEDTIEKDYGWIFFYNSEPYLR